MQLVQILFLVLITDFAFAYSASASEVQTQTTLGTGLITEALSYNGDNKSETTTEKGGWNWNLSYSYSATKLGATANAPSANSATVASDHTSSITGGFGYSDRWEAGLDLNYAKTPEENLSSFGPSVHLGYTFDLATPRKKPINKLVLPTSAKTTTIVEKDEEEEPFVSSLNFTATLGTTKFDQDYLTALRAGSKRKAANKAGSQSISQREGELSATLNAFQWMDFEIYVKGYHYSRDVGTFLANLDDPRAVRTGAASFGSTLSGFSSSEEGLDFTFHLPLDIDLHPEYFRSTSASDGSKTNSYKLDLSKLWAESWKTGLGYEKDDSDTDTQKSVILTVSYQF